MKTGRDHHPKQFLLYHGEEIQIMIKLMRETKGDRIK